LRCVQEGARTLALFGAFFVVGMRERLKLRNQGERPRQVAGGEQPVVVYEAYFLVV